MIKRINQWAVLFYLIFYTQSVWAVTNQSINGGSEVALAAGTNTSYISIMGPDDQGEWNTSEVQVRNVFPAAGTLSKLYVSLVTAPGASPKARTFTLFKNGNQTSLTCTASGTSSPATCSDTTNSVSISAGNLVSLQTKATGVPTGSTVQWSLDWQPTKDDQSVLLGGTGAGQLETASTTAFPLHGQVDDASTISRENFSTLISAAGSISGLYVALDVAPNTGNSYVFTLELDGVNTALTCTVSGAGSNTTCNDTTNVVAVAAGQLINIENNPTSSPDAARVKAGVIFDPTTTGGYMIASTTTSAMDTTGAENFGILSSGAFTWETTTLTNNKVLSEATTLKNLYVWITVAPGASKTWDFTVLKNGTATALTCQLTNAGGNTCNDTTHTVSVGAGDVLSYKSVATGGPATPSRVKVSVTGSPVVTATTRRIIIIE